MIRAIVFDCFGVLTETAWDQLIAHLSKAERTAVVDARKAFDRGLIDFAAFQQAAQEGAPQISGRQLHDVFVARKGFHKNELLLELISKLRPRYKIGILSNAGNDWVINELLMTSERKLFDVILLSHNVGMVKPDPEIFQLACQKLALKPQEVIMVDDRQYNIEAAQGVGMQGILYTNFIQFKHDLDALITDTNH